MIFGNLKTLRHISTVTIDFKLADIKLDSSEAFLLKLKKNLSWGFEVIDIFGKNVVLNICRYLKRFYIYKKINNSFLKFDRYGFVWHGFESSMKHRFACIICRYGFIWHCFKSNFTGFLCECFPLRFPSCRCLVIAIHDFGGFCTRFQTSFETAIANIKCKYWFIRVNKMR